MGKEVRTCIGKIKFCAGFLRRWRVTREREKERERERSKEARNSELHKSKISGELPRAEIPVWPGG
jgi:hypothetical protein